MNEGVLWWSGGIFYENCDSGSIISVGPKQINLLPPLANAPFMSIHRASTLIAWPEKYAGDPEKRKGLRCSLYSSQEGTSEWKKKKITQFNKSADGQSSYLGYCSMVTRRWDDFILWPVHHSLSTYTCLPEVKVIGEQLPSVSQGWKSAAEWKHIIV